MKKKVDHLVFRVKVMEESSEAHRIGLQFPHPRKASETSTTERLTTRHSVERKPPSQKKPIIYCMKFLTICNIS
jgi:hypothetical protein